jgi:DNA-binding transcriptional LysR family regulator
MNLTFRQLRVFVEVAQQGSMARAAEALQLTPPAVSMQIKEVETQVGLPLFDRTGRAVRLSTAGEYFLVHARRLLAALKDADQAMARLKGIERGLLTVGMVSTAKYFVPQLLARFQDDHRGVEVKLTVAASREQLVQLLQAGEVDLSIMGRPPRELVARAQSFAAHPLVFVAAPSHPLAGRRGLPVAALTDLPMILREHGSGTRNHLDTFLAEQRFTPRVAMELASNETIKQAVIAGLGMSFLSLHMVGLELRNGLLVVLDIQGTPLMRSWNVVHLGGRALSPAAEAFRDFLLAQGEAFLAEHDAPLLGRPAAAAPPPG